MSHVILTTFLPCLSLLLGMATRESNIWTKSISSVSCCVESKELVKWGKTIVVPSDVSLSETYSMTLLTIPANRTPFAASIRVDSNNQFDYAMFLAECIQLGYIVPGDVLIMDNASVHVGRDTFGMIVDTLDSLNVRLFLLPAYSPELNPCEFVFAFIKQNLRATRNSNLRLTDDIMNILVVES